MHRFLVLFFLPLSAVASGPDTDSCADTWEVFFALEHGAVASCDAEESTRAVVQDWVALDDAFGADAPPGVADCQSVDVVERAGKAGESCTRYDSATLCRSVSNPHRSVISRGDGVRVGLPRRLATSPSPGMLCREAADDNRSCRSPHRVAECHTLVL